MGLKMLDILEDLSVFYKYDDKKIDLINELIGDYENYLKVDEYDFIKFCKKENLNYKEKNEKDIILYRKFQIWREL